MHTPEHQPSCAGRHPGSVTGPPMRGEGESGYRYLDAGIENRIPAAPESSSSPKAVDRAEGFPTSGRPTPRSPVVRRYQKGGEVEHLPAVGSQFAFRPGSKEESDIETGLALEHARQLLNKETSTLGSTSDELRSRGAAAGEAAARELGRIRGGNK